MNRIEFIVFCISIFGVSGIGLGIMTFSSILIEGYTYDLFARSMMVMGIVWMGGLIFMFLLMWVFPNTKKESSLKD